MSEKFTFEDGFVSAERMVLKYWKENDIIKKSFARNPESESFTFYDGPPTANGKPHIGHVLTRAIKDIMPRYKSMRGYKVLRKAGWDTQGLPVELEVEKQLGITGKAQIEEYGVENFIKKCKESVFKYVSLWEDMSDKVGFWLDMDNPYITYKNDYIESVWWALKTLWEKDLIYKGHKVMPYCARCGTSLSSHEVAQGYADVTDLSAIAQFKLKDRENTYILAWTTTPWTLPSNTALTLNKAYKYAEVLKDGKKFIVATDLVEKVFGAKSEENEYEIIKEYDGSDLLDLEYEQLLPFVSPEGKAFRVLHGDYVTLSDGTGVVHTAPAYGEDDSMIAAKNGIATLHLVDKEGKFVDEVTPFAGMHVKDTDKKIIDYLKEKDLLFSFEKYKHSYPHCWRCDEPLLYYPTDSWFVKSTAYKEELIANNQKINWLPEHIKDGRFGNFLDNVVDWAVSRDRYWGTPLPIWECECGHREMVGSVAQLHEKGIDVPEGIELHKPYIDNIHLKCEKCGNENMTRVREVIDAWFDSGSMPFAQFHYPFENKELFEENFPAQFISEAVDQTRGWFYTLHNLGTALFGRPAFENCIVMGHILDKKGVKQSKSKGNAIEPHEILDTTGADAMRWHFYSSGAPWLSKRLSVEDVVETQKKFMTLSNVFSFYELYSKLDNFNPYEYKNHKSQNAMDKWIISKLHSTLKLVEENLDKYLITNAAVVIDEFIDELSNWYVRRSRERFWADELTDDKVSAFTTLHEVLVTLSVMLSPFVPFTAEVLHQNLVLPFDKNAPESVHLTDWINSDESLINSELEREMEIAYEAVKLGRNARNGANIKNRQPLSGISLSTKELPSYYLDMVKSELNVKEIELGADLSKYVSFEILPNLPVIGKQFGKLIPKIKADIASRDQMELALLVEKGDEIIADIDGTEVLYNNETLLINMHGLEGFAFAGGGSTGLILDTTLTPELIEEGFVREILSKLQNLRKDTGFEVSDKIEISISGSEKILELLKANESFVMGETLAEKIFYDHEPNLENELSINGEKVFVSLKKI